MIKIENKQQYYSAMAEIENYLQRGFSKLSKKEDQRLHELSVAIEAYEMLEFPMPVQPSFNEILIYVMQKKGLTQTELSKSLDVSKSFISEVLSGKKEPNVDLLKNLHFQFHIDGNILLDSLTRSQKQSATKRAGSKTTSKTDSARSRSSKRSSSTSVSKRAR
ncbi:MAG: helix-turn-helix domain-containing protein [Chitinophagaceae bacterium]|nr:helix-turn-helix domain-containing protein [Chitinophagaceae bacterium]